MFHRCNISDTRPRIFRGGDKRSPAYLEIDEVVMRSVFLQVAPPGVFNFHSRHPGWTVVFVAAGSQSMS